LNGDSTFFKDPFSNLNTHYQFTGDPFSNTGWTEINLSPSTISGNFPGERSGTMSFPAFSLDSGESQTVEFSLTVAQNTFRTGFAEYLPLLRRRVGQVGAFYNNQPPISKSYALYFSCPVVVGENEKEIEDESWTVQLYPNPTQGQLSLRSEVNIEKIEIRNGNGAVIQAINLRSHQSSIDLSGLAGGVYFIALFDGNQWIRKKILLLK
jgi:hypothetical protein